MTITETATPEATEPASLSTDATETEAPDYVIHQSAVQPTQPDVEGAAVPRVRTSGRTKAWRSGWCGGWDECLDGRHLDAAGTPIFRCFGQAKNGANVTPRYVSCSCKCHTSGGAAIQHVNDES